MIPTKQKQILLDVFLNKYAWYRKRRKCLWYKHRFTRDGLELSLTGEFWALYSNINRYSKVVSVEDHRDEVNKISLVVPPEDLSVYQRTEFCLNMNGVPLITLTESKIPNIWYHRELPFLFSLVSRGFVITRGTKEGLIKRGLGR